MALITCSDCGASVSDRAPACPKCGAPIAAAGPGGAPITVVTELTSKRLKRQTLLSAATIVIGFIVIMSGAGQASANGAASNSMIGSLLILGGIVWLTVTRIRIWWNHK